MTINYFNEEVDNLVSALKNELIPMYGNIYMHDIIWRVKRDFNVKSYKKSKRIQRAAIIKIAKEIGWETIEDAWPINLRN